MLKKVLTLLAALCCLLAVDSYAQEDQMTLTTYYPSPYGSYVELSTQKLKVGKTYSQAVVADNNLIVEGRVGIGTTDPQDKLEVYAGSYPVRIGESAGRGAITLGGVTRTTWPASVTTVAYGPSTCGSGWLYSTATCPSGYVRTGCSGFFNYACWGDWFCEYLGTYPSGSNGCTAIARGRGSDYCVSSYAYCLKIQ
jgi:hypothetical protein